MKSIKEMVIILIALVTVVGGFVFANSTITTPQSSPDSTGVTLEDIFNKISGTASTTKTFGPVVDTSTSNFHDLGQIYDLLTPIDPNNIASGTTVMGVAGTYDISALDPSNVAVGVSYGTSSVGTME